MPLLFSYLLKLSVSLSIIYLFYQVVLRKLTFYNWNRFYLLCYTALSFLIPFINITPVLEKGEMMNNKLVHFIPSVNAFNVNIKNDNLTVKAGTHWTSSEWILFILALGALILLFRLLIQLVSFNKMVREATLISDEDVKLYQVDRPITPFSFGNSIFINQHLHSAGELEEIIRHEFIHVKQKHTGDIIWSEVLCILNWYNPFAWFIRSAIRQNLEFIADDKVLQTGIDKKQYQYLLLKVTGNNHFSIAQNFNFSSLKKRIAMMNKMKSTKVHLVKFLFVLPLMSILLLAFRKNDVGRVQQQVVSETTIEKRSNNLPVNDTIPVNRKGFNIDIKNENGKDIVIVKDKYSRMVKEVALSDWNRRTAYYEGLYGEGVAEAIDYAVKKSMGLLDKENVKSDKPGKGIFMREQVNNAKVLHVIADTIAWIASKNKFFFKGKTIANDIINDIRAEAESLELDWPKSYVSMNGKEFDLNKDYISYAKTNYWIITLSKKDAIRKYGSKGENGAVEIFSQD